MFAPRGIAIVGASDRSAWSRGTFANLLRGGYSGGLHLVNPKGGTVHGRPALTSLREVDGPVDLAYVLTGPDSVPAIMGEAHEIGCANLVVIAAGFGETGEVGRRKEQKMVALAESYGQRILGPNNLGFINALDGVMAWSQMMPWPLLTGGVGFLSQSGALGIFLLNHLEARDVGISHMITLGNEAMLTVDQGIDYLVQNDKVKVIALYVEAIRRPGEFLAAADRALRAGKPIVAYKAGRGELSARVAAAHTGGLVGDDRVVDAVFRQHGIIRADSMEDLATTAGLLDAYGVLPGGRVGFVTGSGAMCALISDSAEQAGLKLPEFSPDTVQALRDGGLPDFATPQNPLDVTGYVIIEPEIMTMAQEKVTKDPSLDVVVFHGSLPTSEEAVSMYEPNLRRTAEIIHDSPVPVIPMDILPIDRAEVSRRLRGRLDFPHVVDSVTRGIPALVKSVWWSDRHRAALGKAPAPEPPAIVRTGDFSGAWSERQARELIAANGIPVVPASFATDAGEAASAARTIGYPVALKIVSPALTHKTEVGGVALGLDSEARLRSAYDHMRADVAEQAPEAPIEGVLVTPMRAGGTELLVGVVRDSIWGLTLAVALGGVWVEVLQDSALRVLPIGLDDARQMLTELRGFSLLTGARGTAVADLDALAGVIHRIAELAVGLGDDLAELEVNPLRVDGETIEALDVLVRWTR